MTHLVYSYHHAGASLLFGGTSRMTDDEVDAALTEVPGIGPWTAHGFLILALDRPDVLFASGFEKGA